MIKNFLNEIDKDLDSYSLSYGQIDCTYLLRNQIITTYKNSFSKGNKKIRLNKKVLIRLFLSMFTNFLSIFKSYKYWVFSNAERRKLVDGIYIDRVASFVNDFLGATLYIENPVISKHQKPSVDPIFSDSSLYFCTFILTKIFFNKNKLQLIGDINYLESKYGITIKYQAIVARYIGQYWTMKQLLKIKSPKIAFMVYPDGYSGYVRAFKEKKIKVIELQHGIIYEDHPSYKCALKSDLYAYRPDYILTYGDRDNETLENIGFLPKNKIITIGSYALWLYKNRTLTISEYLNSLLSVVPEDGITIAVSATVNDLEFWVNMSNKIVDEYPQLYLFILPRIHSEHSFVLKDNVKIVNTYKTNAYELIKACDYHTTVASTTAIEALYFDKPSLIFEKTSGESLFRKNYPSLTSLQYTSTLNELAEKIIYYNHKENLSINYLFEQDFDKKFKGFINAL